MPQVAVGEATEAVWFQLLDDVHDDELQTAVIWFLKDTKSQRWPTPAHVLEYVKKYRNWDHGRAVSDVECRACNGLGVVRTEDYRGRGAAGYKTCLCPFGRSKALWLEKERKEGRAWTSRELEQRGEPNEEQEEIPF